jgi:hypothetical protein
MILINSHIEIQFGRVSSSPPIPHPDIEYTTIIAYILILEQAKVAAVLMAADLFACDGQNSKQSPVTVTAPATATKAARMGELMAPPCHQSSV